MTWCVFWRVFSGNLSSQFQEWIGMLLLFNRNSCGLSRKPDQIAWRRSTEIGFRVAFIYAVSSEFALSRIIAWMMSHYNPGHYYSLVYTTQVNSAFRAIWLVPSISGYQVLVYTTTVNSAFRAIWLVPLSRDIKYYSPPGGFRRVKWRANPILS